MFAEPITRRHVLRNTTAATFLLAGSSARAGVIEDRTAPARPGLRQSCSSLAFSDRTWEAALAEIRRLGFRYAELAMFEGWTHVGPSRLSEPEAHGRKIAAACHRLGLVPVALHANFALAEPKPWPGLTVADPAARRTLIEQFEHVLICAEAASVPLINVQPGSWLKDVPHAPSLQHAAATLRAFQERAEHAGVHLSFENHTGSIAEQPDDALALLEAVPGLGLDLDLSHVVANRLTLERIQPLLKHVVHADVRNARPGDYNAPVNGDHLDYDLGVFLDVLQDLKPVMYLSVEYYEPKMQPQIAPLKTILEHEGVAAV